MDRSDSPLVVVVGGDSGTRTMVRFLCEDVACEVIEAPTLAALHSMPRASDASLIVLVGGEREAEVLDNLLALRQTAPGKPTVLLSRTLSPDLRRQAFGLGLREAIPLPLEARELQRRIQTALGNVAPRPIARSESESVRAGGLLLRPASRELSDASGWVVRLTRRETDILQALMLRPGQVVRYPELMDHVWGEDTAGHNSLAVCIRRLRSRLTRPEMPEGYIRNVHGQGYMFEARLSPRAPNDGTHSVPSAVLVVDDDKAIVDVIVEALQHAGYTATCTAGEQAPTLARQTRPALILLDINMPGMDGVEVRRHLRSSPHTANIPVIAISAGGNLRQRASEIGADDFLAKPFDIDELLLRVEKWVRRAPSSF